MDADRLALQTKLEACFSKNQLIPRIKNEFLQTDIVQYMQDKQIDPDFGIALMVQMVLHKRAGLPVLVGILQHHFDTPQDCADALKKAAEADLVDWNGKEFVLLYDITPDVQEELDRFQYPLPMVVPPRHIKDNYGSGYLMGNSSVILKDNHHNDDVCLDHLNRVNQIRFSINERVATLIKNSWRNLDKPKECETKEDFMKRVKAFEKYDRTVKDVMKLLADCSSDFYLTHRYDKRGRIYCQGYHVNYQGAPWNKAVIELADKEYVI
jgi:hypothetical protein